MLRGDRKTIYCEGNNNSIDILFYRTILGIRNSEFELKPMGSSNTLLCFAFESHLIAEYDFCLIDRDFRTDDEVLLLENKYKIKFLPIHEIENLLLNVKYLEKLEYIRANVNIQKEINKVVESKRVRFIADFLQFKINTHLDRFPRIKKLKNNELEKEEDIIPTLLSKLEINYTKVEEKTKEIQNSYIQNWKEEYDTLILKDLPAKEIFSNLKDKIFINFPEDTQIIKDIALLMEEDNFMPPELREVFV